jgi:hypothetical protein
MVNTALYVPPAITHRVFEAMEVVTLVHTGQKTNVAWFTT